jgi:hypothetical protein
MRSRFDERATLIRNIGRTAGAVDHPASVDFLTTLTPLQRRAFERLNAIATEPESQHLESASCLAGALMDSDRRNLSLRAAGKLSAARRSRQRPVAVAMWRRALGRTLCQCVRLSINWDRNVRANPS